MNIDEFAQTTQAEAVSASLLQRKFKVSRLEAERIMNKYHPKPFVAEKVQQQRVYYFETYWAEKNR